MQHILANEPLDFITFIGRKKELMITLYTSLWYNLSKESKNLGWVRQTGHRMGHACTGKLRLMASRIMTEMIHHHKISCSKMDGKNKEHVTSHWSAIYIILRG